MRKTYKSDDQRTPHSYLHPQCLKYFPVRGQHLSKGSRAMDTAEQQSAKVQGVTAHSAPVSANDCESSAAVSTGDGVADAAVGERPAGSNGDRAPFLTHVTFCSVNWGRAMLPVWIPCEASELLQSAHFKERFPNATRILRGGEIATRLTARVVWETCVWVA